MNMLNFNDDTDEVINQIESVTSYYALRKIKELYEDIHQAASCGEIYYTARKSAFETKFDITLSDGRNIGEITIEGDYDNVSTEVHEAVINGYKIQAEKVLSFLDDKIHRVEKDKSKNDRIAIWYIIGISVGIGFILYCLLCLKNLL